jgi:hypothetical protein
VWLLTPGADTHTHIHTHTHTHTYTRPCCVQELLKPHPGPSTPLRHACAFQWVWQARLVHGRALSAKASWGLSKYSINLITSAVFHAPPQTPSLQRRLTRVLTKRPSSPLMAHRWGEAYNGRRRGNEGERWLDNTAVRARVGKGLNGLSAPLSYDGSMLLRNADLQEPQLSGPWRPPGAALGASRACTLHTACLWLRRSCSRARASHIDG